MGFTSGSISSTRCTTTRLCNGDLERIEAKLDLILKKLGGINGIKDFGIGVLANIVGNRIDGKI